MGDGTMNPLAQKFTAVSLLKFAFPTMITMLFMGLYTIGDTIFVSRFVNTDALSAINMVTPVINIIVGLGTMLATGGSAVIARKMGEGKEREASQDFALIVFCGAALGIWIAVTGVLCMDEIIRGLGAGERLFPYCRDYLMILLLFTPASILQVLFQNLIVTAGRPGFGMALSLGAGAANVVLDYIFMVPFGMGIRGSALGTGMGYFIQAAAGVGFFLGGKGNMRFERPALRPGVLAESCANGCSELVSQAAAAVTTFLFNGVMMRLLGEDGVAAVTILIYTQFLLTAWYIGFSMGVAPVISYHFGGQNEEELKRIFHICLRFIAASSVLVFSASMAAGSWLAGIFSPVGTAVYRIARDGFLIFPFSFLFCGWNIFASSAFTALSNGKISAVISFLRTFGLITLLLLVLPEVMGVTGVWLAVPAAEFVTMLVSARFLRDVLKNSK